MHTSPKKDLLHADLTESILNAFYHVYNRLDYGFLESIYAESLSRTLVKRGHVVERQVPIVVYFEGEAVGLQRVDMIVDGAVILEIKSTHDLSLSAHRQIASYLRASEMNVGLLLHFGPRPRFHRFVDSRSPRRAATDQR